MTISVCTAGLVADGKITKGQAEEVEKYYHANFQRLKQQMDMMAAADLASDRAVKQMQAAINRRKLLAAKMIEAQTRLGEQLRAYDGGGMSDGKGGGPINPKALPALLGGNDARHVGGTLEGKHMAVQAQIDNMMRGVLLKHGPDVIGRITDKAGLDDLGREAFGQDTGNVGARDLAKAWDTAREWTRGRANAAGADIGKLTDYGLQMHWDSTLVRDLPNYQAFEDMVLPHLDRTRMIDHDTGVPFTDEALRETMDKVWQGIRSEGWDDREPGGIGRASMANDGKDPRFFVFKDYDSWNRVNDQLGSGNAFTSMNGMLEHRARQIAALEVLGPNPEHQMKWLQDVVMKSAQTDMAPGDKVLNAAKSAIKAANNMWQEFKGQLNQPDNKRIAEIFGTYRNLKSSAVLGSAFISQLSDMGLSHQARIFNGLPEWKTLGIWLSMLKPNLTEDRNFAARQLMGLVEQRHYTATQARLYGREFAKPWSSRLVSTVMNLQGSARWAQAGRHHFGIDWWGAITDERGKTFDQLDPVFRGAMERGGFDAASWDQLRATPTEAVNGTPWIIADNVADENLRLKTAEMILRQPAGAVAASVNPSVSALIIKLFTTPYFRVYPSQDLVGCELAGATKSVIALAVGMAVGLDLGENTQSMIITRGLSEVARFGQAYGADPLTNLGLAGMGDLVASCGYALSRNRTFGEVLGRTGSMDKTRAQVSKTVEGVASAPAILELAHRVGVEVPIIEAVADVVSGNITPNQALDRLMTVPLEEEI